MWVFFFWNCCASERHPFPVKVVGLNHIENPNPLKFFLLVLYHSHSKQPWRISPTTSTWYYLSIPVRVTRDQPLTGRNPNRKASHVRPAKRQLNGWMVKAFVSTTKTLFTAFPYCNNIFNMFFRRDLKQSETSAHFHIKNDTRMLPWFSLRNVLRSLRRVKQDYIKSYKTPRFIYPKKHPGDVGFGVSINTSVLGVYKE